MPKLELKNQVNLLPCAQVLIQPLSCAKLHRLHNMEIAIVLGLLVLAIVLFSTEKMSVDVVTLLLLVVLATTGVITAREAFEAFSSDFIIMLASIFVITHTIESSGVLDALSDKISKTKTAKTFGVLVWMMPFTGLLSAFMNNTTLTALLIPPILAIAKRSSLSPSLLLMPMAFASIIGGTCSLLGTSTNIAVSGYLAKEGIHSLGIFDITPIGLVLMATYLLYMLTVGKWLLPERKSSELIENYKVREYMSEVKILPGSKLIGQSVYDSSIANSGFIILSIIRGDKNFYPYKNSHFEENDLVLIKGNVKDLLAVKDKNGIDIVADILWNNQNIGEKRNLQLREVLIPVKSELNGQTVKSADFRNRFGLVVVAINRIGHNFTQKIGSTELRGGDLLLVQGTPEKFVNLHGDHELIYLDEHPVSPKKIKQGIAAISLFVGAVLLTTFKVLPIDIAFVAAALGTVLLGIIKPADAYHKIDWRMLVLIAGMSAFGTAMKNSGADAFLARHVVLLFEGFGPSGIMFGFMLITVLLTQPMSNAAAALVVLPIALQSAEQLQVSPLAFGIAVMLSASVSIITPFEPSCILIYGPGKYKFIDFIKVGGPLTLVLMGIIYFLVPIFFPLNI